MRISRPCYDKMHRCPGWAGGGDLCAKVDRCDNGRITVPYGQPFWKWRFCRCDTCGVLVLPWMVRWLDWRWIRYALRNKWRDVRYGYDRRRMKP